VVRTVKATVIKCMLGAYFSSCSHRAPNSNPEDLKQFELFFKQREIYTIKLPVYNPENFLSQVAHASILTRLTIDELVGAIFK
jgi:hypothetical protein